MRRAKDGAGLVVQRAWWPKGRRPGQVACVGEQRACCTFVYAPTRSCKLPCPKFRLETQHIFKASDMRLRAGRQPKQVRLLREKPAWMTMIMGDVFDERAACDLKEVATDKQAVLLMDAAPQHVSAFVVQQAAAAGR